MQISSIGQMVILFLGGATVASFLLSGEILGTLTGCVLLMSFFVFRSTTRELRCRSVDMVAPIEGRVVDFSPHYIDQKLHFRWQRIDIKRYILGPWALYSPLEGRVVDVWFQDNHELGCLELAIQIRSSVKEDFLLVLVANAALNYFDGTRLQPGSILGKGGDLGFCTLRYVSICVPPKWVLSTTVNDRVHARAGVLFHIGR